MANPNDPSDVLNNPSIPAIATVGLSARLVAYNGVSGELDFASDTKQLVVQDGITLGGFGVVSIIKAIVAPSVAPKFIGQIYIDTTHRHVYISVGTASSSDYLLIV